jgi:hypothetical protein
MNRAKPSNQLGRIARLWLPRVSLPLALVVVLLRGPLWYRDSRLVDVPDIGDPFDGAAAERPDADPDENAVRYYQRANEKLSATSYFQKRSSNPLEEYQAALDDWRKGTECPRAVFIQPNDRRERVNLLAMRMEDFAKLAEVKSQWVRKAGHYAEAWQWLRAILRCSRHCGQHGTLFDRSAGNTVLGVAIDGIQHFWLRDADVPADVLRQAVTEYFEDESLSSPPSTVLRCEYLRLMHAIDARQMPGRLESLELKNVPKPLHQPWLFLQGDPEYSRRLVRLAYQNWLAEIDKPFLLRASRVAGPDWLTFYDLPAVANQSLSAAELLQKLNTTCLAQCLLREDGAVDLMFEQEAVYRKALGVVIACHWYDRQHGEWPEKLEQLVPDVLQAVPQDPFGKPGVPLLYRRNGRDILIYSVFKNGSDDGGKIDFTNTGQLDQGFRVQPPRLRK